MNVLHDFIFSLPTKTMFLKRIIRRDFKKIYLPSGILYVEPFMFCHSNDFLCAQKVFTKTREKCIDYQYF